MQSNPYSSRKMIILELLNIYERFNGKTIFQKFIYFLASLHIKDLDYHFIKHHYGPYSYELEEDLNLLCKENYIKIENMNGKMIIKPLKDNISNFFEDYNFILNSNNLQDLAESNIKSLFEYELKSLHRIELAATLHFFIKREEFPLKKLIFNKVEEWEGKEGKFSEKEKLEVWEILISSKLIGKEIIIVNEFYEKFSELNKGKPDSYKFQNHIKKILKYLFPYQLDNIKIENKVNFSRKRLDIFADNTSQKGFFLDLHKIHKIKCPYIVFECKNSSLDLKNPAYDQIGGQLSDDIGFFGILVCRKINDKVKALNRLKDLLNNTPLSKKYVIILEDSDFKEMLRLKLQGENPDKILKVKLKELKLNQPKL